LKDSRGQKVKDSSEMLQNYRGLKVWQKAYKLGFKDSRIQGVKGSSEILQNYRGLKVCQKAYKLCLEYWSSNA
jgi:hypothetical protein